MDSDDANKGNVVSGEVVSSSTREIDEANNECIIPPSADHHPTTSGSGASMKNDESAFAVVEIWQVRISVRCFTRCCSQHLLHVDK